MDENVAKDILLHTPVVLMECVITVRFAIQINAKIYRFQRTIWKWRLRVLKESYKER